jgi:hypothetical protein
MNEVQLTMDDGKTWHNLPVSSYSHIFDIGASLSPFMQPYLMRLQAMEAAELRRKNEEQIASALGVPADLLFNPLVQRLLSGPLSTNKFKLFTPSPSPRRAARRRHRRRMKRR